MRDAFDDQTLKVTVEMTFPTALNEPDQVILDGYIVPSKYLLRQITKILLLLTIAYSSAFRIAYMYIYLLRNCKLTTKLMIIDCAHATIVAINVLLTVLMLLFAFDWNHFRKFISHIKSLSLETDRLTVRTIKQNRRITQALLIVTFIIYMIIFYTQQKAISIDTVNPFVFNLLCFHEMLIRFVFLFFLNMICNICFWLKAAFNHINSQISDLHDTSDQSFGHLFCKIRDLRQKYSYAVRSTQSAEKLFRWFITLYYIEYFTYNIVNIVMSLGPKMNIDSIWLLFISIATLYFIILTYYLVSVNNLSREGLEDLYELSFKLNTAQSCHENDIFIARMALSDVGFTFANLFTINNNFITSVFTLSFTIIITLASFIYQ
uniref:Gustatory receptor n=1 Tax=Tetranychus urticae TaxID=32264 RepID=T1JU70_TETUR